jgi:hypothetical protein
MRSHLQKSIELSPKFVEAYGLLGYVALVLNDEVPETENAVKKAISFAPGRHDLVLMLAQLMLANDETLAARAVLSQLTKSADRQFKERIESLQERIQSRLDNEAALRDYRMRREAGEAERTTDLTAESERDDRPVLRREEPEPEPPAGPPAAQQPGPTVEGFLTSLDCTRGLTLQLRVESGFVELHSDRPSRVEFMSQVSTVKDSIGCGPIQPAVRVVITYARTANPRYLGEPLKVEFVPER